MLDELNLITLELESINEELLEVLNDLTNILAELDGRNN